MHNECMKQSTFCTITLDAISILHDFSIECNCKQHCWLVLLVIIESADQTNNSYNFIDVSIKISHSTQKKREIHSKSYDEAYANTANDGTMDAYSKLKPSGCGVWWHVFKWRRQSKAAKNLNLIWHILFFSVIYDIFNLLNYSVSFALCTTRFLLKVMATPISVELMQKST